MFELSEVDCGGPLMIHALYKEYTGTAGPGSHDPELGQIGQCGIGAWHHG